jgi:hypothetical protein
LDCADGVGALKAATLSPQSESAAADQVFFLRLGSRFGEEVCGPTFWTAPTESAL